jgi:hypothetical protein
MRRNKRASEAEATIRKWIGDVNCRHPAINPPLRFQRQRIFYDGGFRSVGEVKNACEQVAKRSKSIIKTERQKLQNKRLNAADQRDARETIAEQVRILKEIPEARAWMTREMRREYGRVNKIWRATGYGKALARRDVAWIAAVKAMTMSHLRPQQVSTAPRPSSNSWLIQFYTTTTGRKCRLASQTTANCFFGLTTCL